MPKRLICSLVFVLLLGVACDVLAELPTGWSSQDIGTTGGSASESGGIWTVTADGNDIWGYSDQFHFACRVGCKKHFRTSPFLILI